MEPPITPKVENRLLPRIFWSSGDTALLCNSALWAVGAGLSAGFLSRPAKVQLGGGAHGGGLGTDIGGAGCRAAGRRSGDGMWISVRSNGRTGNSCQDRDQPGHLQHSRDCRRANSSELWGSPAGTRTVYWNARSEHDNDRGITHRSRLLYDCAAFRRHGGADYSGFAPGNRPQPTGHPARHLPRPSGTNGTGAKLLIQPSGGPAWTR